MLRRLKLTDQAKRCARARGDSAKTQHRIRLAGIDAPKKKQAFGTRSRENLSKWVYRRDVIVEWHKKDR